MSDQKLEAKPGREELLEKQIDEVGRERVFRRAESYGWHRDGGAPEWVWWGIVDELRRKVPPPRNLSFSELFGFRA